MSLWLGIIAAWKAGALPGLLDAELSADTVPYCVGDVDAPVVAAASEHHDMLLTAGARSVIDLDELVQPAALPPNFHGPDATVVPELHVGYSRASQGRGAALGQRDPDHLPAAAEHPARSGVSGGANGAASVTLWRILKRSGLNRLSWIEVLLSKCPFSGV